MMLVSIGLAFWLTGVLCDRVINKSNNDNDFYAAVNAKRAQDAANCSQYIPNDWQQWMRNHEPPTDTNGDQMLAPLQYLLECLRATLVHVNGTSPFSLIPHPHILYNMALNEVLSFGFDGTLVTKARSS